MTSLIDSFKDVITAYHEYQKFSKSRKSQLKIRKIAVLAGKLDQVSWVLKKNACFLSLKGDRLSEYSGRFYKHCLPYVCVQFLPNIMEYLNAAYSKKWEILLGRRAGYQSRYLATLFHRKRCRQYSFLFSIPRKSMILPWAAFRPFYRLYLRLVRKCLWLLHMALGFVNWKPIKNSRKRCIWAAYQKRGSPIPEPCGCNHQSK